MTPVFQDSVIVITGASEGIGRALCHALAPQGPKLVLAARNEERLLELKSEFVLSEMHRRAFDKDGQALGQSPLREDKVMTAETCADLIIKAMQDRERLAILSMRGKAGRLLKLFAPGLMDRVAAKAIREAK